LIPTRVKFTSIPSDAWALGIQTHKSLTGRNDEENARISDRNRARLHSNDSTGGNWAWPLNLGQAGATIVVTSAADGGAGTLCQALLDAQDGDTITFDPSVFPPTAPVTIPITSELPGLVSNLTIDASSAVVILDGSHLTGNWRAGLQIVGSTGTIIRGLQIW